MGKVSFKLLIYLSVLMILSACNSSSDKALQEDLGVIPPSTDTDSETTPDDDSEDDEDDEEDEIETFMIFGGNYQAVSVGGVAGLPLSVLVRDEVGALIENQTVSFTVEGGAANGTLSSATPLTNASGIAQVTYTAGSTTGTINVTATAIQGSKTFSITVNGDTDYVIQRAATNHGNSQTGNIDSNLALPLKIRLTNDETGLPIEGVSIRFVSIGARTGDFSSSLYADVITDSTGHATSPTFTLGTISGSYTIRAYPVSDSSTNVDFSATATVPSSAIVDASNSEVSFSSSVITADGISSSEMTITAKDAYGNLIPNNSLPIVTNDSGLLGSTWSVGGWVYASAGTYTRTITAGTTTGTISFSSITLDGVSLSSPPSLTLSASSTIVNADTVLTASSVSMTVGGSAVVIIATLKNSLGQSVALSGQTLVLSTSGGTLVGSSMTYHSSSGTYRQTLTPPATAGTVTVELDSINASPVVGVDIDLPVNAGVPSLSYASSSGTTGTAGTAMSITPSTLTNNGAAITQCTLKPGSANAGSWPNTITINSSTCVISGTPTATLTATIFTIIATNSTGVSSDATVSLTINATQPVLSYAGATGTSIAVGANFSVTPTTLTQNGAAITDCYLKPGSANFNSFPAEASINSSTCVITSTSASPLASTQFTIVAENSMGLSNDATVTLHVNQYPTINNIADTSTNEDVAKVVNFIISDPDTTIACNSTYISKNSSNTTLIPNANIVIGGTLPNCTATITPVTNLFGTSTITLTVSDGAISANDSFVLTVNQLGDDVLSQIWPFDQSSDSNYVFDDDIIELVGGVARIKSIATVDNSTEEFEIGTHHGTAWDETNGVLRLTDTAGCSSTVTNCAEHDSSWTPKWSDVFAYWKMNNSWVDGVNAYNGTANGDATFTNNAKIGLNAGAFDGTGDFVRIPTISLNSKISFSTWVKLNSLATFQTIIGGCVDPNSACSGGDYKYLQIGVETNGAVYYGVSPANAATRVIWGYTATTGIVRTGEWTHIAVVIDSTTNTVAVYVNGVSYTSTPTLAGSGGFGAFSLVSDIGALYEQGTNTNNSSMNGTIDDMVLWNNTLTSAEVTGIYQRQRAKFAGTYSSRVFDLGSWADGSGNWTTLSWKTSLPFLKELPPATNEIASDYSGIYSDTLMTGIKGLWHLNEASGTTGASTVIDSSGNSNHGTPTSVTFGNVGRFNNSMSVSNSGYFTAANSTSINITTNTISMSAWILPTSYPSSGNDAPILGRASSYYFTLGNNGKINTIMYGTTPYAWMTGATTIPLGVWTHVGLIYNGVTCRLYVNGILDGTVSLTGNISSITHVLGVGAIGNGTTATSVEATRRFIGRMDEVAIWGRALDPSEMLQLYRRGSNRIKFQIRSCNDSNCSGESWLGPDNTIYSDFNEFYNNSTQSLTPSGAINTTSPIMTFLNFGNGSPWPINNRYFQYRAFLESDDVSSNCNYGLGTTSCSPELKSVTIGPTHYDSSTPTITNATAVPIYSLSSLSATSTCAGVTKYQISTNGTNWYYWTGAAWASTINSSYTEASSSTLLNTNIGTFPGTGSDFYFRAFLKSSGITPCEIDTLSVGGLK